MNLIKRILTTAALTAGLAGAPAVHAEKYGLLVAIEDYSAARISSLPGCLTDLKGVRSMLTSSFGVPEANLTSLANERATKAGVLAALNQMIAKAKPGDSVVFYYSGHGGQVPDLNDDDETADGLDEVLITSDFNPKDPDSWLLDDHLRASLSNLKTKRVLILIDACHAGTSTRNVFPEGVLANKSAEFDFDAMIGRGRVDKAGLDLTTKAGPDSHVLIASCAANELSAMGVYGGERRSLFTTALIEVLPRQKASDLGGLRRAIQAEMQRLHADAAARQTCQVESRMSVSLAAMMGDAAAPSVPALDADPAHLPSAQPADGLPTAFPVQVATNKRSFVPGDEMVATVISEKPGYLRLYYIDKTGMARLLFPNGHQPDNRIDGAKRVQIGDASSPFLFRMTPPGGTEMLLAAVSPTQFTDHAALALRKDQPLEMGKVKSVRQLVDSGTKQVAIEGRARPVQIGRAIAIYDIRD